MGRILQKKIFMLKKLKTDFLRSRQVYPISQSIHDPTLGTYYFVFNESRVSAGKDQALIQRFDKDGIPLNRTYIDVHEQTDVYFPISIGQMGLSVFHTYLETRADNDRDRFMKFVRWFETHAEPDSRLGIRWMTAVPLPQYRNPGPWASAFSQSRAISILLRGYQLTGEKRLLGLAEKALIPFTFDVRDGGVTALTKWGPFYEEYPAEVPTLVLNGMIFSLCGLHDFVRVNPDHQLASELFQKGVQTVRDILPEFDMGFWSKYNLCKAEWYPEVDPATMGYQRLHATQLEMLAKLTGDTFFETAARRFRKQDQPINWARMFFIKYRALKKLKRI